MAGAVDGDPITIVLADDHTIMRRGLGRLLDAEPGLSVVGEAATLMVAFEQVRARRPAVLVLDLNMPGGSSLEAIPRLKALCPQMRIVVLTMEDDPGLRHEATRRGAGGFVLKDGAESELLRAIRG